MFEERDVNKDGKLSADEMPEQMKGRMEQFDTDKDGSVSREEMRAMMSRMQRGGGRDAGRGGPEGGGRPGGDRPRRPEAE
jgi:Ca2+-binding EF-hand superfamily protein